MENNNLISDILNLLKPEITKERVNISIPIDIFFLHVLERIYDNLYSISRLKKLDIVNSNHSIGLIYRNILSDFITVFYVILQSNEEEKTSEIYKLYKDDIKKFKSTLEKLNYEIEDMKIFLEFKTKSIDIFNHVKEFKIDCKSKFPNTTEILKQLKEVYKTDETGTLQLLIQAFDFWYLYSKYEHIGIFSMLYKRTMPYDNKKNNQREKEILKLTLLLISQCFFNLNESLLKDNTDHLYRKYFLQT